MKMFVVNSVILSLSLDAKACAVGAPKMLIDAGVKNAKVKSCYCCEPEGRVVFIVDGESRDAALEAFLKIVLQKKEKGEYFVLYRLFPKLSTEVVNRRYRRV